MHPVITQQLVADHIREMHARAEAERRARQARRPRRRAPSIRLSGVVAGVLGVGHASGEQRSALVRRGAPIIGGINEHVDPERTHLSRHTTCN